MLNGCTFAAAIVLVILCSYYYYFNTNAKIFCVVSETGLSLLIIDNLLACIVHPPTDTKGLCAPRLELSIYMHHLGMHATTVSS